MSNEPEEQSPYQRARRATTQFCFTYEFDGRKWGGDVWAATVEEAEMKIKAMGKGKIDGIVKGIIPAE